VQVILSKTTQLIYHDHVNVCPRYTKLRPCGHARVRVQVSHACTDTCTPHAAYNPAEDAGDASRSYGCRYRRLDTWRTIFARGMFALSTNDALVPFPDATGCKNPRPRVRHRRGNVKPTKSNLPTRKRPANLLNPRVTVSTSKRAN